MDTTFMKLIQRGTQKMDTTIGKPWETIPIKNRKYAKDCSEVHLAKRGIQQISDFEFFPNLEVLWLNDNKIEVIDGLDANFRIKQLYLQNNKVKTLEGSLEYMKHLETLLLYNNELRDLDKNIEFLKNYPHLTQLDMFQNPLCEEPNYRLRVIYNLPQLKLLDRHVITLDERQKAKKLMEQDDYKKNKKDVKKRIAPSQMFSLAEKDLYKDADKIKRKQKQAIENTIKEEERKKSEKIKRQEQIDATKVPKSKMALEMEQRKKQDPTSCITEFEKDKLKPLFKKYDTEKKGVINNEGLSKIYKDMVDDECLIGLVPRTNEEDFIKLVNPENEENLEYFMYCYNLSQVHWTKPDEELTKKRIKEFYHTANQKLNRGNQKQACEDINIAIRLQTKLDQDNSQPIFQTQKKEVQTHTRFDSFDFNKYKFRQTFQNTAKSIL